MVNRPTVLHSVGENSENVGDCVCGARIRLVFGGYRFCTKICIGIFSGECVRETYYVFSSRLFLLYLYVVHIIFIAR